MYEEKRRFNFLCLGKEGWLTILMERKHDEDSSKSMIDVTYQQKGLQRFRKFLYTILGCGKNLVSGGEILECQGKFGETDKSYSCKSGKNL